MTEIDGPLVGTFRGMLIDCDGVLVDSLSAAESAWRIWAEGLGLDGEDVIKAGHGRRTVEAIAQFVADEAVAAEVDRFVRIDLAQSRRLNACPGAPTLVGQLDQRAKWAVVTSANRSVAAARLTAARLARPPVLVAAEDVINGKPAPDGYLLAARRLGLSPSDCLALDDLEVGVAAATAAGAYTVLVGQSPELLGTPSIRSLADINVTVRDDLLVVRSNTMEAG